MVIFREAAWRSRRRSTQGRFILKKRPATLRRPASKGLGRPELVGEGGDITPPLPGRPGTNSGVTTIHCKSASNQDPHLISVNFWAGREIDDETGSQSAPIGTACLEQICKGLRDLRGFIAGVPRGCRNTV